MGRMLVVVLLSFGAAVACSRDQPDPVRVHFDEAGGSDTGSGSGSSDLPKLAEKGGLSFEIVDTTTNKRMPGKLTIVGVKGTADARLSKGDIGKEDDNDNLLAFDRVFSLSGVGVVALPVGTYDVTASRGL